MPAGSSLLLGSGSHAMMEVFRTAAEEYGCGRRGIRDVEMLVSGQVWLRGLALGAGATTLSQKFRASVSSPVGGVMYGPTA